MRRAPRRRIAQRRRGVAAACWRSRKPTPEPPQTLSVPTTGINSQPSEPRKRTWTKEGQFHMSLRISGKHMEIGDAFRSKIEGRIDEAVGKYFDGGYGGSVTVEKSGSRFSADCLVHLDTGISLQAAGQAQDPQLAFDAAAERI